MKDELLPVKLGRKMLRESLRGEKVILELFKKEGKRKNRLRELSVNWKSAP